MCCCVLFCFAFDIDVPFVPCRAMVEEECGEHLFVNLVVQVVPVVPILPVLFELFLCEPETKVRRVQRAKSSSTSERYIPVV